MAPDVPIDPPGTERFNMRDLVDDFIGQRLSRRAFMHSLGAIGVSAAGIGTTVRSAEAITAGTLGAGQDFTGTGGELLVEQMKAAGVKYMFTNPGSFEVGLFDAFLDQPMQLVVGLHEGIVISMADGYNKVTGDPAFVGESDQGPFGELEVVGGFLGSEI